MAQDERLALFRAGAGHNGIGLDYLPAVARRLLHCRDLGEPFDFLTWFEFAPNQAAAFDEMLRRLRATEEWSFVEREVEVRLGRIPGRDDPMLWPVLPARVVRGLTFVRPGFGAPPLAGPWKP